MVNAISGNAIAGVWLYAVKNLLEYGDDISPRGMKTKEILNASISVNNGLNNIFINKERDLNYRFMVAEWLWITAGLDEVDSLLLYNSQMKRFSDDGLHLSGAYGPRLMPQIPYILDTLRYKTDSRQAVATIWSPNPKDTKDLPCTISLQWFIRDELVHCTVNMRSSDVWLGLPYDYFTFSQLTNLVAALLDREVGSVTMNLGSSHLYEEHWKAAERALSEKCIPIISPQLPNSIGIPKFEELKGMLWKQPDMYSHLGLPWTAYGRSLIGNKAFCLEVLRELSTK
jgi:thymidylate synthase